MVHAVPDQHFYLCGSGSWFLFVADADQGYQNDADQCLSRSATLVNIMANLPPVSLMRVLHLDMRISLRIFEKIWNDPNIIFMAWGKIVHEKNLKLKISWHCPFKDPHYGEAWARSLESLMEGHNWFFNQFVEIPWRSVIVCLLSL
jgi:hypothetical protein